MGFIIDNVALSLTASGANDSISILPTGSGAVILDLFTMPTADGSAGQALTTDAGGNLDFVTLQAQDDVLDDLAALAVIADDEFIVGTGAGTYANESGSTARGSMGAAPLDAAYITSATNSELSAENVLAGTSNEIDVATSTIGLADNPTIPGTGAILIPVGTTGQEPSAANGKLRYDSTTNKLRTVISGTWQDVGGGGTLSNVVEDTSPQLGADLDAQNFKINNLSGASASVPALNFSGDNNTGMWHPGADIVSFTGGGKETLRLITDAAAVNHLEIENEATGSGPIVRAAGTDSNIDLVLNPKADGDVVLDGLRFATLTNTTANNTPTELFLNGSTTRLTVASGDKVAFKVTVTGKDTSVSGDVCMYIFEGAIKNISGTTSLSGTAFKQTLAEDDANCDAAVTADDTNDSLKVEVTGIAATNYSWTAKVEHFIM